MLQALATILIKKGVENRYNTTIPDIKKRRFRWLFFANKAISNNTSTHKTGYSRKKSTFDSIKYMRKILSASLLYFINMEYNSTLLTQL